MWKSAHSTCAKLLFCDSKVRLHAMARCIMFCSVLNRYYSAPGGRQLVLWSESRSVMLGESCLCCYGRASGWKSERLCNIMEDWSCSQKKWEQMTKEQHGLAWHPIVSYGVFPPLRLPPVSSLSLFDSHAALAWYPRLRQTNEDVSLLLKTMAVIKMTVSFPSSHPPSHPLPPPRQMDRGESQAAFFKSISASVLLVCVYGLMKWKFFYRKGPFKAARSSAEAPFLCAVVAWRDGGERT